MGVDFDYRSIDYRSQAEFDYFFATAFDRYDTNGDGVIDYAEFQPLINDMCQIIKKRYGYGPTVDKIRAAWSALDFNKSGYITRNEFSYRARYELERILTQPDYIPLGYTPYGPSYVPPAYPGAYVPPPYPPAYPPYGYVPPPYPPAYPPYGYVPPPYPPAYPPIYPPPYGRPAFPPVVF